MRSSPPHAGPLDVRVLGGLAGVRGPGLLVLRGTHQQVALRQRRGRADEGESTGPTGRTATADVAALRVRVLAGPATTGDVGVDDVRLPTCSVGPVPERA